jgi:ribosomal protein S18 acetylase RimI-like enzyme
MSNIDSKPNVEIKYDYQLSKTELNQLFILYNEIFYQNRVRKKDLVKQIKQQLGKSKIFLWYLIREPLLNRLVAMGSFIYDYGALNNPKISKFDINQILNENICNIGVHENYRRLGYAKCIMEKIMEEHENLTLEVKKDSPIHQHLIHFYQKLGFQSFTETNQGIYMRRKAK